MVSSFLQQYVGDEQLEKKLGRYDSYNIKFWSRKTVQAVVCPS